jgi:hypothetical protein
LRGRSWDGWSSSMYRMPEDVKAVVVVGALGLLGFKI